ncbi:MAG: hypothetical protein NT069_24805 [Planctomycetota bacterium]|nr:hypothetical protein [Planctomycetota bacterium]
MTKRPRKTDREAHVWQLDPLESVRQFSLKENPDAITLSLDGRELVVVTMTSVRTYSLESGQPVAEHVNLPPNAVLGAAMTEDGGSVRVICQPRILDVQLKNGTVTELVAFTKPQGVYFYASLSHGAKFAVAQGNAGIEHFDLDSTTQSRLVAGLGFIRPVVTRDGGLVAAPYLNGNGVWDTSTGKPLVKYADAPPAQLVLSADDRRLLGWSLSTANLKLWEMTTR